MKIKSHEGRSSRSEIARITAAGLAVVSGAISLTPAALAGAEGHGGRVWECQPKNPGDPKTYQLIDVDRGLQRWKLSPQIPDGATTDEIALQVVKRLETIDACRYQALTARIASFESRVNDTFGHDLPDPGDTYDMTKPEGCEPRTVVNQDPKVPRYSLDVTLPGIRFDRDPELWGALDPKTQAGIKIHESIYEEVLGTGRSEADPAIYLTAILLSSHAESMTALEWESYATEAGLGICRNGILVAAKPGSQGWTEESSPWAGDPKIQCTTLGSDQEWNGYRFVRDSKFCVFADTKSVASGTVTEARWRSDLGELTVSGKVEFYPATGVLRSAAQADGRLRIQGEPSSIFQTQVGFDAQGMVQTLTPRNPIPVNLDGEPVTASRMSLTRAKDLAQGLIPTSLDLASQLNIRGVNDNAVFSYLSFARGSSVLVNDQGRVAYGYATGYHVKLPDGRKVKGKSPVPVLRDASGEFLRGTAIVGADPTSPGNENYIRVVHSADGDEIGFRLCSLRASGCSVLGSREFYPDDLVRRELRLDGVEVNLKPWVRDLIGAGVGLGGLGLVIAGVATTIAIPTLPAGAVAGLVIGSEVAGTSGLVSGLMIGAEVIDVNNEARSEKRAIRRLTKRDSLWVFSQNSIAPVTRDLETELAILDDLMGR